MKTSNKAAAITLGGVLFLTGCSGSSDVNPYAKIFGTTCSVTDQAGVNVVCLDGELPDVLAAVDEALELVNNLLDQLTALTEGNPLTALLPIGDITDQLTAALDQATAAINEQLIGALPDEVSGAVDQALVTAMADSLTQITNLISPALPDDPQTGDPLDAVRTALAAANNPTDIISAATAIQDSLLGLQSGLRTSALLGLVGDLTAASSSLDDAPALLAGALEGVATALASGDPAAVASALEGLTDVASADDVTALLESVPGGLTSLINLNPEDLTGLGSDDALEGITGTIGNLLGLAG